MKKMRFVFAFLIVLVMATAVSADFKVKKYKELMKDEVGSTVMQMYIDGLGNGFGWANADLRNKKIEPLYCQPGDLVLNTEDFIRILDSTIIQYENIARKKNISQEEIDNLFYIEPFLLKGLQANYPCR